MTYRIVYILVFHDNSSETLKKSGRHESDHVEGKRWYLQALADIKSAQILYAGEAWYMVCFVCQQAAGKALKAYLYSQGMDFVFGHAIAKLCEKCSEYDVSFVELREAVKNLDHYYIGARYPNGLPESIPSEFFFRADADTALRMSGTVIDKIARHLSE